VADTLESVRTADGGYGKAYGAASGSTYHTFLVGLTYELLGRSLPDAGAVRRFVASRRRDDGGYVEVGPMRRSGTNPTVAAVGLLELTGGVPADVGAGVVNFLAALASEEGGVRANAVAPLADLLSPFTAAWTLDRLGGLGRLDAGRVLHYARQLERP